jgi:hypothetical protein
VADTVTVKRALERRVTSAEYTERRFLRANRLPLLSLAETDAIKIEERTEQRTETRYRPLTFLCVATSAATAGARGAWGTVLTGLPGGSSRVAVSE